MLQPRLLHCVFEGSAAEGSSDSDSGAAGASTGCASPVLRIGRRPDNGSLPAGTFGTGWVVMSVGCAGASLYSSGVSSMVECFAVVHPGMAMNSSKVNTRGLQHFHPVVQTLVSL